MKCRQKLDCGFCQSMDRMDVIPGTQMTKDLFLEKYAETGRPLVVTNISEGWPAMEAFDYDFFKNLYLNLNR